jgi:hypothetical protein
MSDKLPPNRAVDPNCKRDEPHVVQPFGKFGSRYELRQRDFRLYRAIATATYLLAAVSLICSVAAIIMPSAYAMIAFAPSYPAAAGAVVVTIGTSLLVLVAKRGREISARRSQKAAFQSPIILYGRLSRAMATIAAYIFIVLISIGLVGQFLTKRPVDPVLVIGLAFSIGAALTLHATKRHF